MSDECGYALHMPSMPDQEPAAACRSRHSLQGGGTHIHSTVHFCMANDDKTHVQGAKGPADQSLAQPAGADTASKEEADNRSVYVGQVDYSATPEELQVHFKDCGTVNRVTILTDKMGNAKVLYQQPLPQHDSMFHIVEHFQWSRSDCIPCTVPRIYELPEGSCLISQ